MRGAPPQRTLLYLGVGRTVTVGIKTRTDESGRTENDGVVVCWSLCARGGMCLTCSCVWNKVKTKGERSRKGTYWLLCRTQCQEGLAEHDRGLQHGTAKPLHARRFLATPFPVRISRTEASVSRNRLSQRVRRCHAERYSRRCSSSTALVLRLRLHHFMA